MIYIYCVLINILLGWSCPLQATEHWKEKSKFKQIVQKIFSYKPQKLFKHLSKKKKKQDYLPPQHWQENPLNDNRVQINKQFHQSYSSETSSSKSIAETDFKVENFIFTPPEQINYLFQNILKDLKSDAAKDDNFSFTLEEKKEKSFSYVQTERDNKRHYEFDSVETSLSESSLQKGNFIPSFIDNFYDSENSYKDSEIEKMNNSFSSDSKEDIEEQSFYQQISYKSRLFLGEADFSYTLALLNKHSLHHPGLAQAIIATELRSKQDLSTTYPSSFTQNIRQLEQYGVKVLYGIDATQIAQHFPEGYARIHFNFPHNRCPAYDRSLSELLQKFFLSASKIQNDRDRIHVALPHVQDIHENLFKQAYVYGLYDASYGAGYKYLKKRRFDKERYPGYRHRITGKNSSAKMARQGREYIFVKVSEPRNIQESSVQKPVKGKRCVKGIYNCLPAQETDSESTSYENLSFDNWSRISSLSFSEEDSSI